MKRKDETMYLNENLYICLLALQHRYPRHTIDLNHEIIAMPNNESEGWTAEELLTFFSVNDPPMLMAPAHLIIDASSCEIYLPLRSTEQPAFYIHCRGKIPSHHPGRGRSAVHA